MRRGDTGRFFPTKYEAKRQDRDIVAHQRSFGTSVLWYFFDQGASAYDDIYGEGQDFGGGRRWFGPVTMPVLSANRLEGVKIVNDDGLYSLDTINLRVSYEQVRKSGLVQDIAHFHETHLNDRFIYDNRVWGIQEIRVTGQFDPSGHDVVAMVAGSQIRADELVNDLDFGPWSLNSEDTSAEIIITPGLPFTAFSIVWEDSRGVPVPLGEYEATLSVYATTHDVTPLLVLTSDPGGGLTLANEGSIQAAFTAPQTTSLLSYSGNTISFTLTMASTVDIGYTVDLLHLAPLVVRVP